MKIYLRLVNDSRLQLEEVNEETFNRRAFAQSDDGHPRYVPGEYLKISGGKIEMNLTGISHAEMGWVTRLMNVSIPTGSNPDFLIPLGPVRFKNRNSVVLITPSGEVFKKELKKAA